MAGSASNALRSAFVVETTPGTTPATPSFKTLHAPILFDDAIERYHQRSLTAGGAIMGDTMIDRKAAGTIKDAPLIYGVYDSFFESLLQSTFSANVLTDGKARQAMTIENAMPAGLGGTQTYKRYKGVEAIGASISIVANQPIKFNMDFHGMQSLDTAASALTGATYTDPNNADPMSAVTDFGTLTLAGYTLDDVVSATINFDYQDREPQPKIGGDVLNSITRGAFMPSVKLRFYVDTNYAAIYDAARQPNQTPAKLTLNLGSVTLKKYKLEFWDCYLDMAAPDYTNPSAFLDVTVTPAYNRSNSGVLTFTRALA